MEENKTIEINTIPARTWSWLKMNGARLRMSAHELPPLTVHIQNERGARFIDAKTDAQLPLPSPETGIGVHANPLFENPSVQELFITAERGEKIEKPIILTYTGSGKNGGAGRQIIHAKEDADITVIFIIEPDADAEGIFAVRTTVYAEKNASVRLIKAVLSGKSAHILDDTGIRVGEGARVTATHILLGGQETYIGLAASLEGDKGSFRSDTAYACTAQQRLDMNFIARHSGKKTESRMTAAGALYGSAHKTYRGTIDFQKGSAGSLGDEQEETLLLSPDAVNKSIPMILCGEEDISGEHGATIGRLSDELLFYMQARGFSKTAAENAIAQSKIRALTATVPDESVRAKITDYLGGGAHDAY